MESTGDYNKDREIVRKDLQEFYNFNEEQATILEQYIYNEYHSYWEDYLNYYDETAQMVSEVIKAKQ